MNTRFALWLTNTSLYLFRSGEKEVAQSGEQPYRLFHRPQSRNRLILSILLTLILGTIGLDFLYAYYHNGGFYVSESLLFSTYWLLFFPFLHIQAKLTEKRRNALAGALLVSAIIVIHTLCYPALVLLLSAVFFDHHFAYRQTLNFSLPEYGLKTVIVYGLASPLLTLSRTKSADDKSMKDLESRESASNGPEIESPGILTSIIISEGTNRKAIIATKDVLYFEATPPYIKIQLRSKKCLLTQTLKSLESRLDPGQFIRIHKSHIVNISEVVSLKSRGNGDYDLTLSDASGLRLSRNYAAAFKTRFVTRHSS